MATNLQKVKRGDPLAISAATFNTFIDVAHDFQQRQLSTERNARPLMRDAGVVLVRNESGSVRSRFDVLGIAGVLIEPVDNADEFQHRVALRGVTPTADHVGRFVVLLEPLGADRIGRACLDGICVARVRMHDEAHQYADVATSVTAELESSASGTAQLLWIEPESDRQDPEIAWTVARLGGGGSSVARWAEVTGFATGLSGNAGTALQCRLFENGAPTGDPFTVEVWSRNNEGDAFDLPFAGQDVFVSPPIVIGAHVRVEQTTLWDPYAEEMVDCWLCVQPSSFIEVCNPPEE